MAFSPRLRMIAIPTSRSRPPDPDWPLTATIREERLSSTKSYDVNSGLHQFRQLISISTCLATPDSYRLQLQMDPLTGMFGCLKARNNADITRNCVARS